MNIDVLEQISKSFVNLDLSLNQIANISSLKNSIKLFHLNLSHNQIESINALQNLTALTFLDLSFNKIVNIDVFLNNFKKLELLYLSNNKIISVEKLNSLSALWFLDLSFNQIFCIDSLKTLISLNYLYLSNNQVYSIDALKHMKKLQVLDLSFNRSTIEKFNFKSKYETRLNIFIKKGYVSHNYFQFENFIFNSTKKAIYLMYKTVNLITIDDLHYYDCNLTLYFIKRNILLNLYANYQFDSFMSNCGNMLSY